HPDGRRLAVWLDARSSRWPLARARRSGGAHRACDRPRTGEPHMTPATPACPNRPDNKARSVVRIGGASGFWGDTAIAAPQLLEHGEIDFLVFDYLAVVTMSILAAKRAKDPEQCYANDFVDITMRALLPEIRRQGVRVVAIAGCVHPLACCDALARVAAELGVVLKI